MQNFTLPTGFECEESDISKCIKVICKWPYCVEQLPLLDLKDEVLAFTMQTLDQNFNLIPALLTEFEALDSEDRALVLDKLYYLAN